MPSQISYPLLRQPLVDAQGYLARPWQQFFQAFFVRMGADMALTNLELEDVNTATATMATATAAALAENTTADEAQSILQAFRVPPRTLDTVDARLWGATVRPPAVIPEQPLFASRAGLALAAWLLAQQALDTMLGQDVVAWTPALEGATTPGTQGYTLQVGSSWQLGRVVYAHWAITLSSTAGMAGDVLVTGLPFTSDATSNFYHAAAIGQYSNVNLSAGYTQLSGRLAPGVTQVAIRENGDNIGGQPLPAGAIVATSAIWGSVVYYTA